MAIRDVVGRLVMQENKRATVTPSFPQKLAAGAIAGITGTSIIFPIDTVKTRLQNQARSASASSTPLYRNGLHCFRTILATEGTAGLYRGLVPNLIGVTPEKAIKLAVNDFMRERLAIARGLSPHDQDALPSSLGMLAGGLAGLCQVVATNPMEITKIRMQVASTNLKPGDPKPSTMAVVRELGIRGLYKGVSATLARDIPFSIMFFEGFARTKQFFIGAKGSQDDSGSLQGFAKVFAASVVAGVVSAALVTPMDVVKTRLQVKPKIGDPTYAGMLDCYRVILRDEGIATLFRGSAQRAMIVAPLFGISLCVYEVQKMYLSGILTHE